MNFNRIGAFTLGVVITAVSVGVVNYVSAAGTQIVYACAKKSTGVIRYVPNKKCTSAETSLSWNVSGQRGKEGPQGLQGARGLNGETGDAGSTGAKGDAGSTGAKGDAGSTGAKGDTGSTGAKGDTGSTGAQGDTGPTASHFVPLSVCGVSRNTLCAIGSTGPGGGLVFFIDETGVYPGFDYLEAAPTDASAGVPFTSNVNACGSSLNLNCQNNFVTTAGPALKHVAIGTGQAATTRILNQLATVGSISGFAAASAEAYTTSTADDWFLPSYAELGTAFQNLRMAGLGGFSNTNYWTSSEMVGFGTDPENAFSVDFSIPQQYYFAYKSNSTRVRAIRSF